MKVIKVLIKKVNEHPVWKEIPHTLEAMQEIVGGYIEAVSVAPGVRMYCNESGKLIGLPYNFTLNFTDYIDHIAGDVFFVSSRVTNDGYEMPLNETETEEVYRIVNEMRET